MRVSRSILLLALLGPALTAQQVARQDAPAPGRLEAEVHFIGSGDAWFSTNQPAYVAVFDVSRSQVTQVYPTFSAQATVRTGAYRKMDLLYSAALPTVQVFGASSLVSLAAAPPPSRNAWPHILLLVASTSPLRVSNWWTSSFSINQQLFSQRHWTDLQSDAGIDALVQLVRPLDPTADLAIDREDAIVQPVRAVATAAYDPNRVAIGYSCIDGNTKFFTSSARAGAFCVAVRNPPPDVNAQLGTQAVAERGDQNGPNPSQPVISEHRNISDPAEIRRFIESQAKRQGGGMADRPAADGMSRPDRAAVRREADANPASRRDLTPAHDPERRARTREATPIHDPNGRATSRDVTREARQTPATAPTSAPSTPTTTLVAPPAAPVAGPVPVKPPIDE